MMLTLLVAGTLFLAGLALKLALDCDYRRWQRTQTPLSDEPWLTPDDGIPEVEGPPKPDHKYILGYSAQRLEEWSEGMWEVKMDIWDSGHVVSVKAMFQSDLEDAREQPKDAVRQAMEAYPVVCKLANPNTWRPTPKDDFYPEWDSGKTYNPGDEVVVLIEGHRGHPIPVAYRCAKQNNGVHPHYRESEHQDSWRLI